MISAATGATIHIHRTAAPDYDTALVLATQVADEYRHVQAVMRVRGGWDVASADTSGSVAQSAATDAEASNRLGLFGRRISPVRRIRALEAGHLLDLRNQPVHRRASLVRGILDLMLDAVARGAKRLVNRSKIEEFTMVDDRGTSHLDPLFHDPLGQVASKLMKA